MTIAYTSTFGYPLRTIAPPQNFTVEPLQIGSWGNKRLRFTYCLTGSGNTVTKMAPVVEVNLHTDNTGFAIRIPGGDRTNPALGFLALWNWPDDPDPANAAAFFPCAPDRSNGDAWSFNFSPGDLRFGGQKLIPSPFLGPSYNYKPDGVNYYWKRPAIGIEGKIVPDPVLPPLITSHGLAPGGYSVCAAYLLPNGTETARTPWQTIILSDDKRAILCHRNESVQQGVAATVVYVNVGTNGTYRYVFPRNWCSFYISRLGAPARLPAFTSGNWKSNPLVEALDSDADQIVVDTDFVGDKALDVAPVIPYKPNITMRFIKGDGFRKIVIKGSGELLTVNAEPHVHYEDLWFYGDNVTQGRNYCDHLNSGINTHQHFINCNFRGPNIGYWRCVDDAGAALGVGSPLYRAGHTDSEEWNHNCGCDGEDFIAGLQSVNFKNTGDHRQDIAKTGFEVSALHASGNGAITYEYLGLNGGARSAVNCMNQDGLLGVNLENLFADQGIPVIVSKGGKAKATVRLAWGKVNRARDDTGALPQALAISPNGPLVIDLEAMDTTTPKAYGQVKPVSIDPDEAKAVQVVPVSGATQ